MVSALVGAGIAKVADKRMEREKGDEVGELSRERFSATRQIFDMKPLVLCCLAWNATPTYEGQARSKPDGITRTATPAPGQEACRPPIACCNMKRRAELRHRACQLM